MGYAMVRLTFYLCPLPRPTCSLLAAYHNHFSRMGAALQQIQNTPSYAKIRLPGNAKEDEQEHLHKGYAHDMKGFGAD